MCCIECRRHGEIDGIVVRRLERATVDRTAEDARVAVQIVAREAAADEFSTAARVDRRRAGHEVVVRTPHRVAVDVCDIVRKQSGDRAEHVVAGIGTYQADAELQRRRCPVPENVVDQFGCFQGRHGANHARRVVESDRVVGDRENAVVARRQRHRGPGIVHLDVEHEIVLEADKGTRIVEVEAAVDHDAAIDVAVHRSRDDLKIAKGVVADAERMACGVHVEFVAQDKSVAQVLERQPFDRHVGERVDPECHLRGIRAVEHGVGGVDVAFRAVRTRSVAAQQVEIDFPHGEKLIARCQRVGALDELDRHRAAVHQQPLQHGALQFDAIRDAGGVRERPGWSQQPGDADHDDLHVMRKNSVHESAPLDLLVEANVKGRATLPGESAHGQKHPNWRHSRESGNPNCSPVNNGEGVRSKWIPAFAGMTTLCECVARTRL